MYYLNVSKPIQTILERVGGEEKGQNICLNAAFPFSFDK